MKVLSVFFGLLAALVIGLLATLFTASLGVGIAVFVVLFGLGIYGAAAAEPGMLRTIGLTMVALFIAGGAFIGWQVTSLIGAFTDTDGPADPADAVALAAANDKIDGITDDAGFRIDLSEDEIQAVVQDALSDGDSPLKTIIVDIVDGEGDDPGTIHFTGEFKSGGLSVEGVVSARLEAGAAEVEVESVSAGMFNLPGVAKGAIEDVIEEVSDLNSILAESRATVQSLTLANDRLTVTGTQADGELLTSASLLSGLAAQADAISNAVNPPPERFGPGVVNGTSTDGSTYYVALGDSLAANVGVSFARDGYVSRLHNQLQIMDGASYGLRNFGISGETSGTLIRSGQLDEAISFMESNPVTYVTLDIGANDLLGHLGSADCSEDLEAVACQDRMGSAFASYEVNMVEILDRIQDAAPDATILFMRAYNPFSLGFGASVGLEQQTSDTLQSLNDIAADLATARGMLVADAFTPMEGTAAATTHMVDNPPDIHPLPIGFDILAGSFVDALSG
jgi:lysophospholipase L1-like esterase